MTDSSSRLNTVEDWIERSDRNKVADIDGQTDDGESISGFRFTHGNNSLDVLGKHNVDFCLLKHDFSVVPQMAAKLYIEDQDINPPEPGTDMQLDIDLTEEDHRRAAQRIAEVNEGRSDSLQKLEFKLIQELSHPDAAFELQNDLNGPYGFSLRRKLFVDDMMISDFDQACQALVSISMVPQQLLGRVYNTEINLGTSSEQTDPSPPHSRAFQ